MHRLYPPRDPDDSGASAPGMMLRTYATTMMFSDPLSHVSMLQ